MSTFAGLVARVRALVRRSAAESDLDDEIRFHLDMETEKNLRTGMAPDDARRVALAHFGGVERVREEHRDVRRLAWLEDLFGDARFAARSMRRTPGLTLTVVLTLSLCIGATSAVYGVIYHLLVEPLPYPEGNRIVSLETRSAADGDVHWAVGSELFRLWAARARSLEDFAVYAGARGVLGPDGLSGGPPDSVQVAYISPSLFSMLRVRPLLGRAFEASDAQGRVPVAMISEGEWRARFGGDPALVGRAVDIDGARRTIIGIVAAVTRRPMDNDVPPAIWLPLASDSDAAVYAFARLRPGVTSAQASRELDAIMRTLPDTGWLRGRRAVALTARDRVDPSRRDALELLFLASCTLLLIGGADIAGLLLVRGWARRREVAIRRAIGASRWRVLRQHLTEAVLLVLPGGALGLIVASLALRAAVAIGPGDISAEVAKAHIDTAVLLWTAAVAVTIALLAGVVPTLLAGGQSIDEGLRADDTRTGMNRTSGRAHQGLVVTQIALCFVFLFAASVLERSFVALLRTPVGYDPAGLFAVNVRLSPIPAQRAAAPDGFALTRIVRNALAATPGVHGVAIGPQPMNSMTMGPTVVEGRHGVRPSGVPITGGARVGPEYFRLVRIPLVRGRGFDAGSGAADAEVIVNDALARRLWPDRDALGARLRLGDGAEARWLTVVGIAGDVRMPGPAPMFFDLQMYRPASVARQFDGTFVLRADGDVASLRPLIARALERAGLGATVDDVVPAGQTLEYAFRAPRFALALFGTFAILGVVLAGAGLFGVVSYAVARRSHELGVRVALGAAPSTLARLVLGQTARIVALGCGIGLLGVLAASHVFRSVVYQVSPADPAALVAAGALLVVVTLAASTPPVLRALRIDPMTALRAE